MSSAGGSSAVWTVRPDGAGEPELVLDREFDIAEAAWSGDGRWLVYRTSLQENSGDILLIDLEDGSERPLFDSELAETRPALSPDGRWIAYEVRAGGVTDIWAATFPDVGRARIKISEGGGNEARWSRDGRELFFRDGEGNMVVVGVIEGAELAFTSPERLFSASTYVAGGFGFNYDVMPSGDTFVMMRQTAPAQAPQLVVIEDFRLLLNR